MSMFAQHYEKKLDRSRWKIAKFNLTPRTASRFGGVMSGHSHDL